MNRYATKRRHGVWARWSLICICVFGVAIPAAGAAGQQAADGKRELDALLKIGGDGGPSWLDNTHPPGRLRGPAASGPSCRGLDVREGVRTFINRAATGGDDLRRQAHRAATAAISGLPWLTLRRALPEVADLFDAELARAESTMDEANNLCKQELDAARQSGGDEEGWRSAAKAQAWNLAGRQGATPQQAEQMSAEATEQGIVWLAGEKRGGAGQPPIRVIADTTAAAAKLLFGGSVAGVISLWDSPEKAAEWLVEVVGDVGISLAGGQTSTQAGAGLWLKVARRQQVLLPQLADAIEKSRRGEDISADMVRLKAARFGLQAGMLDALSRSGPGWRHQALSRMAYELAIVGTLDRALLGRQMLLTALQLPEVVALAPARRLIEERLGRLEQGVQSLLFEYRARQSMGGTLSRIWQVSQP